jgi:hypothetical protein
MRQPSWRQWLVMSIFGAVPMLGCNHASHQCDCFSNVRTTSSVITLPAPAPQMVAVKPAVTQPVETPKVEMPSVKNDTMLQTTAAKTPEPTPATIAVPTVAGPSLGTNTGTLELTAADAEAMGVKPGYTPGAIFMPPK